MGGELDARSTAGEGTFAFTVSFELIDAALVGVPPELSGRRALIVDDNMTIAAFSRSAYGFGG